MRSTTIIVAAIMAVPLAISGLPDPPTAFAQNATGFRDTINGRRLEDAPVSSARTPGVSPADRAGNSESATVGSGPVDSTPFSGSPDPERGEGGPADRVAPADGNGSSLPNLDR